MPQGRKYHEHIQAVMDEMGIAEPRAAVRAKAQARLATFSDLLGAPPYNLLAFASCVGLHESDEPPVFSEDSEIVPAPSGRVHLRLNRERPITRQRFSIAHEIGHTLFPDYHLAVRCRRANERRWNDDDFLETLCDVAASEFMFPHDWFRDTLTTTEMTGTGMVELAESCLASREATVRKVVELSVTPMAAIFFSWKLKPKESRAVRAAEAQPPLFPGMEPALPSPMLRVDYSILNDSFRARVADHVPLHKSVASEGLLFEVSAGGIAREGIVSLELGSLKGEYYVVAIPIYTDASEFTGNGYSSIVAVVQPLEHAP